jgi:hypothetical protein
MRPSFCPAQQSKLSQFWSTDNPESVSVKAVLFRSLFFGSGSDCTRRRCENFGIKFFFHLRA